VDLITTARPTKGAPGPGLRKYLLYTTFDISVSKLPGVLTTCKQLRKETEKPFLNLTMFRYSELWCSDNSIDERLTGLLSEKLALIECLEHQAMAGFTLVPESKGEAGGEGGEGRGGKISQRSWVSACTRAC